MFLVIKRLSQITWAVGWFVVWPSLAPRSGRPAMPVRVRRALEFLGGAWIKMGQSLALRFDLLPPEYCDELLGLLSENKPFPYEVAREIIKEELGRFPEELFASFDPVPIATASIGQVHRATTTDGTRLAVKVQRPRIPELFDADLKTMRMFAAAFGIFNSFGGASLKSFVDEFMRWTNQEVDYRVEARNAHHMSLLSRGDNLQFDAKVRFEYTTRRIIATEFIDGIRLLDIVRAVRVSDRAYLNSLAADGHDIERITRHISWNMFNQVFRDGFFHADLHPANLFVLADDVIGYVDFGIVGRLPKDLQASLRKYIGSLHQGDFATAVDELLRWATPAFATDLDRARWDLITVLEEYFYGTSGHGTKTMQITSSFISSSMSVFRRNKLSVSQSLTLYFKAMLTADAVVFELTPSYDLSSDLKKFFSRELSLDTAAMLAPGRIAQGLLSVRHGASQVLADVSRIQGSGRALELSLETLLTRLALYGFWATIIGLSSYFARNGEFIAAVSTTFGINEKTLSNLLYGALALMVALMLRQGQRLATLDRQATRRNAADRRDPRTN